MGAMPVRWLQGIGSSAAGCGVGDDRNCLPHLSGNRCRSTLVAVPASVARCLPVPPYAALGRFQYQLAARRDGSRLAGGVYMGAASPLPFHLATAARWPTPTVDISTTAEATRPLRSSNMERAKMDNYVSTLIAVSFAILGALSTSANATMPILTTSPKQPNLAICRKWAASQSADAIETWGTQLSGKPSRDVGLMRLTLSRLGDDTPEIVGFSDSVGVADAFCEKHKSAKLCKGR